VLFFEKFFVRGLALDLDWDGKGTVFEEGLIVLGGIRAEKTVRRACRLTLRTAIVYLARIDCYWLKAIRSSFMGVALNFSMAMRSLKDFFLLLFTRFKKKH
jgi:hypothetical protein